MENAVAVLRYVLEVECLEELHEGYSPPGPIVVEFCKPDGIYALPF